MVEIFLETEKSSREHMKIEENKKKLRVRTKKK
jgi:hypothetical protein